MRLEVTRRADLAVRAVAVLGAGRRLKAGELAEALETTPGFVPQVIGPLVKAGWVRSEPGPSGGYTLATAAEAITVLDIVEAIDGPTDDGRCVVADGPCGRRSVCSLHVAWARARNELTASLQDMNIADVAAAMR